MCQRHLISGCTYLWPYFTNEAFEHKFHYTFDLIKCPISIARTKNVCELVMQRLYAKAYITLSNFSHSNFSRHTSDLGWATAPVIISILMLVGVYINVFITRYKAVIESQFITS